MSAAISAATSSAAPVTPTVADARDQLDQADFLRLLTTQLKNQDPMNPADNNAFIAQMAQFAQVSGLSRIEAALGDLGARFDDSRLSAATGYIGKSVLVDATRAQPDAQGALSGAVDVPQPVDTLTLRLRNDTGALIRDIDLGPQTKGRVAFAWDGRDQSGQPAGQAPVRIEIEARTANGPVALTPQVHARVTAISLGAAGQPAALQLAGLGSVPLSAIHEIRD